MIVADHPFNGMNFEYFYLEDFEDGLLNTPGVNATTGGVVASRPVWSKPDSVDADDGAIDGSGLQGHSFYSGSTLGGTDTFTFIFDSTVLDEFPTHVGVVWTDVGASSPQTGFGNFTFEVFGTDGSSLGSIGPVYLGDGFGGGQTAEDTFFGFAGNEGISKMVISTDSSTDWEVDHLQYGFVPVPGAVLLGMLGLSVAGVKLRKHA